MLSPLGVNQKIGGGAYSSSRYKRPGGEVIFKSVKQNGSVPINTIYNEEFTNVTECIILGVYKVYNS